MEEDRSTKVKKQVLHMVVDISRKAEPDVLLDQVKGAIKEMPHTGMVTLVRVGHHRDRPLVRTLYIDIDVIGDVDTDDMFDNIGWAIREMSGVFVVAAGNDDAPQ